MLLYCHSTGCSRTCSIVLSLAKVSNLLVANKDSFLKYEYNNEVGSHKEMLCTFCFYPGAHTTAVTGLLTVKCRIGVAVSFSITMQVAASLLEQAINMSTTRHLLYFLKL